MSEILQNTGAKLWSMVDDHDELQSNVFDQLFGTGGKSDIRLIDEAIGKINKSLNGYYFKIINDKLYICKDSGSGTTSLPLSITDDNEHVALKVDGTSITIDGNGVVHGATVDDAFSLTSENAIQNKVVKAKFDEVDGKINANETTISSHTTALATLNGEGEGSVKKTVTDEIAKVVADAPESLDTLKEVSDWISSHESDASAMNSAIQTNKSDIATLQTDKVDKETGKSLLADTDKANYDDAVSKAHTHDNKSVLDGITSDKVTNWDTVSDKLDNTGDASNTTNTFSEATSRTNIASGEKSSILFGKIKKWFSDLKSVAFSGSYNDLSDKPAIDSALSNTSTNAVQNKVVYTEFEKKLNTDGDSKDLTNTFVSQDSTNVTQWTNVDVLTSGEKHSSVFNKASIMFKNIRYLYKMLGTADISTLGEGANIGTVTGAISQLNSDKPKTTKVNIILSDVEWIQSVQGMFYAYIETGIQNIISVNVRDFNQLRTTDNIHVGFVDSSIYLMSNTNTFTDNGTGKSTVDINVVYL